MHHDELAAYDDVAASTLTANDATFRHQHVVDAFAAQRRPLPARPITVAFALAGLYLHVERGATGRDVQRTHARLAAKRHAWPKFAAPADRGSMTILDVASHPPGADRDRAIDAWCRSVWASWRASRDEVLALLQVLGELPDRPAAGGAHRDDG